MDTPALRFTSKPMIDVNEMFPSHTGDITHASFTIVPGGKVNHAALLYKRDKGRNGTRWAISLYYGYRYNGPDIPIGENSAKMILANLGSENTPEGTDWEAEDLAYSECDECPHD